MPTVHGPEYLRIYEFFVFSETRPGNSPPNPQAPHVWENRTGTFSVPCPEDWNHSIYNVLNLARSAEFSFGTDDAGNRVLQGKVESGTADEGKGFYYATITVRSPKELRDLELVSLSPSEDIKFGGSYEVNIQVVDAETRAQVPGAVVSMRNPGQPIRYYDANQPFRWTFIPRRRCPPAVEDLLLLPEDAGGFLHSYNYYSPPMPETRGERTEGGGVARRPPPPCPVVERPSGLVSAKGYTTVGPLPFKYHEEDDPDPDLRAWQKWNQTSGSGI